MSAPAARTELSDARPDCVVLVDASGERALLSTLAREHPSLPVVHFSEKPVDHDAITAHVDAASESALALLTARLEATLATARAERFERTTRALADTTTDATATVDDSGVFREVSTAFAALVGRDPTALRGTSLETVYGPLPSAPLAVVSGDAERWHGPLTMTNDGTALEREHTFVELDDGTVACFVHPTPGPAELETLRDESSMLNSMLAGLPLSLYAKDTEGRHLRASREQVTPPLETPDGTTLSEPDDLVGLTDFDIYLPNLAEESYADDRRVIETETPVLEKVEQYRTPVNEIRWTLTSKVPWRGPDGEVRGLVGATTDITAKKRHEQEIERQRQRLEEFASVVAHDLRNPLNVARGYVQLATETDDLSALGDVEESLERMEHLIEDVLTLARQGNSVLEPEPVSLRATVEAAWEQVSTADATLQIADDTHFLADQGRLCQLLENLLRNAVEHGSTSPRSHARENAVEHAGETVTVTVEPLENGFGFALEDDGPGIPEDKRERVLESGYTTSSEGTGFGLAIVSQIVDAHGWEIEVTESDSGGARFEISGVETPV
ncbi:hypothetical protein GCM10025298_06460 [Natronobiforma cellulositropha]